MTQTTVGIRELKARLAMYVRHVKAGGTLTVTERGKPIVRLVPANASLEERMNEMMRAGLITWSGRPFRPQKPVARVRGKKTVAEILLENRE
jgi:prevent-host-death family protein